MEVWENSYIRKKVWNMSNKEHNYNAWGAFHEPSLEYVFIPSWFLITFMPIFLGCALCNELTPTTEQGGHEMKWPVQHFGGFCGPSFCSSHSWQQAELVAFWESHFKVEQVGAEAFRLGSNSLCSHGFLHQLLLLGVINAQRWPI